MTVTQAVGFYLSQRRIAVRRLAERTGLTVYVVSRCVDGNREFTAEEYRRVCAALGVSLDFFPRLARRLRDRSDAD